MTPVAIDSAEALYQELWISLTSLLRSYTAVHGLHGNRIAQVEHNAGKILVSHGEKWLSLTRDHANVTWTRENGSMGTMELTDQGTLRGSEGEEAMDLAAEQWAREIMQ